MKCLRRALGANVMDGIRSRDVRDDRDSEPEFLKSLRVPRINRVDVYGSKGGVYLREVY